MVTEHLESTVLCIMDLVEDILELGQQVSWLQESQWVCRERSLLCKSKFETLYAKVSITKLMKMFHRIRKRFPRRLLPHLVGSLQINLTDGI